MKSPEYPYGRFQVFWWGLDWALLRRPVGFFRFTTTTMRLIFRWQLWIGPVTVRRWTSTSEGYALLEARKERPL